MFDAQRVFGPDGLLARAIPGYRPRGAQVEMAEAVARAIADKQSLIAEAGTGTGKTFAYLAPAISSGRRVVVSTGTKNLQDQLFLRDLPRIRQALAVPLRAALLKGRGNYLCLYRLKNVLAFRAGHQRAETAAVESIRRWARTTQTGDIAEVVDVPESSPLWHAVTSTVDNCLGQECPDFAECLLVKARRKAMEAEIVVVNHHLLWADWAVKNDGFGELLPEPDVVVVDEAHQFAETAAQFLGVSITSRRLNELAHDSVMEQLKDARDQPELATAAEKLEHAVADFRLSLGVDVRRDAWRTVEDQDTVREALGLMRERLSTLTEGLKVASVRGKGLESCWKRGEELEVELAEFLDGESQDAVRWFETVKRGFNLNRTPLEIAGEFAKFHRSSPATWIFTSATLSVSGKFDHFIASLGLSEAATGRWESPFDYPNQSLFYLPTDLPEPSAPDYTPAVVRAAVPVLRASRGRAFMLFTSHQALQTAAGLLPAQVDFPLFVQGSQPKAALLEAFRQAGNGVLLGTSSFWEGVDVQGEALSCVIIDKLPFASPGDPVLGARLETLKRKGLSPFGAYQLPTAVIALKQGVGRLIRSSEDRGVLMLCDPRLVGKPYGKVFLNSLPPMRRTRLLAKVEAFFREAPPGPEPKLTQ
ncbi:ATP-dependent DNA helicase [Methylococcus sp. EFPC2]|uniref:ATP-dependent DNA helicase n=1 Tax=Methylococcus sp. EFPC2 TaxID=2812648 RepID=UPI00196737C8|nr:ATP-dependent DNA helicase [Methylococcus sp. EFPC2]QSA95562.1 ATP-dependent DNA helicase [Methylococcus sp. EFPC2]